MQLEEQGKLSLDADVNQYLDFKIPEAFGKPITIRNLMTHTPGFEEEVKDLIQPDPKRLTSLEQYMKTHIPNRIFPPGTIPAYSNYGAGLAGYIVQRVSGEPFEQYVERHIFQPLGMAHSSFRQPLPDNLKPLMSEGYKRASDGAKSFELVQPAPAGALASSANDLAKFAIAHLQNGQYNGAQILKPETVQLMHARAYGLDPQMNAMALGFYEENRNGQRIIGHGGDTIYFHSDLHLVPALQLAFFVSYNSAGRGIPGDSARTILWQHFLNRYFPSPQPQPNSPSTAAADARAASGDYITSRRFEKSILRVASLLGILTVHPGPKNTVVSDDLIAPNGKPRRWQEITEAARQGIGALSHPLDYQAEDAQARLVFRRGPLGGDIIVPDFPAVAYQRVPWYYSATFTNCIVIGVPAVLILALIFWPIAWGVRRHYGREFPVTGAFRSTRIWIRIACLIQAIALCAWLGIILVGFQNDALLTNKMDPWLRLVQIIALVGLIFVIAAIAHLIATWRTEGVRWWSRLVETVIVLACFAYIWCVVSWNMLHWSLNY
jgi:CubicO group peptidase (beta-lactamase class C family)